MAQYGAVGGGEAALGIEQGTVQIQGQGPVGKGFQTVSLGCSGCWRNVKGKK